MNHLRSIQFLRGVAALLVVFFHCTPHNIGLAGEAGVDLFFVISGFVMWIATANRSITPQNFLYQRLIRIVPLYWIFTCILAVLAFAVPDAFPRLVLIAERFIFSLAFIPHVEPNSSLILPLMTQGWTLNYELFFYVLIAAALWLPTWWRLGAVTAAICLLVITGMVIGRHGPLSAVYTNPLLLEFVFGMGIGALVTLDRLPDQRTSMVLSIVGASVLLTSFFWAETAEHHRLLFWGLAGTALVVGLVGLERSVGMPDWKLATLIGDSSFSLYLTHTFVISGVGKATEIALGLTQFRNSPLAVSVVMLASVVVGIIVYRMLEKPLLRWLRTLHGSGRVLT